MKYLHQNLGFNRAARRAAHAELTHKPKPTGKRLEYLRWLLSLPLMRPARVKRG